MVELLGFEESVRRALGPSIATGELYGLALENSPIGWALVNSDGRFIWCNIAMRRFLLGNEPAELRGEAWIGFTHPDDAAQSEQLTQALAEGRRDSFRTVKRYVRPDGSIRWGDVSVTCLRDADATTMVFVTQVLNVSDMVEARQELATSQERYRLLAENASDVVSRSDPEGVLLWVSPSLSDLMGWLPEQLIGTRTLDLAHPDDLPAMQEWNAELVAGRRATIRARLRHGNGDYRWIGVAARPLTDANGTLLGRVCGWRDATSEVAAEAALAASEEHYRLLAENASDIIIKTNSHEQIEWISPSANAVLDANAGELVGTAYLDLVHPDDVADAEQHADTPRRLEVRVRSAGGGWRWMSDLVHRFTDATGSVAGVIHSLRDIDSEREAREELQFLAYHDSLTRLANRKVAERHLEQLLGQPHLGSGRVAVLFIDVDGLKAINDAFGHAAGDEVIRGIARRLVASARADDLVARFGGDEFVVILPSVRAEQDAEVVAEKLRLAANEPLDVAGRQITTGVSIGVALSDVPSEGQPDPGDTLRRADAALYRAKRAGRNRIAVDRTVDITDG